MIEIRPMEYSMIGLKIVEWSNKEQKNIIVADFEVSASNGILKIQAAKDWVKEHRDNLEVKYFMNEPKFHEEKFTPFQGIYIKQIVGKQTPDSTKLSTDGDKK